MLAISSPTARIIEGCLGGRSAETRNIALKPSLFGWNDGAKLNDTDFDPPSLPDVNGLLNEIGIAQNALETNQLAVSLNQPRQLIPFRLQDFSLENNNQYDGEPIDE